MAFRLVLARRKAVATTFPLKEWLHSPMSVPLPPLNNLSATDISRICSTLSAQRVPLPHAAFWDDVTSSLLSYLNNPGSKKNVRGLTSCLHVLDRIAASGEVPAEVGLLLKGISEVSSDMHQAPTKSAISAVDAVLGTRAMLLFGWQGPYVLERSHLTKVSLPMLVSLAQLAGSVSSDHLVEQVGSELISRLGDGLSIASSISTTDLVGVCDFLGIHYPRPVVSQMKSIGTELIRRIEGGHVSVHTSVRLIELFSGNPPNGPIHPLLLQACYSLLLNSRGYTCLSSDELCRCVHGMAQSEIENVILSRCLLVEYVQRSDVSDPRNALRALGGFSVSKSSFSPDLVHALTQKIDPNWCASFEPGTTLTALLNFLYNGACLKMVQEVVRHTVRVEQDLPTLGTLFLLYTASRDMSCRHHSVDVEPIQSDIPAESLEVVEKANPAMPRDDLRKKRLMKRVVEFNKNVLEKEGEKVGESRGDVCHTAMIESYILSRIVSQLQTAPWEGTGPEHREILQDILSGFQFLDLHLLGRSDLAKISKVVDACLARVSDVDEAEIRRSEDVSTEKAVKSVLENLGYRTRSAQVTKSLNRIGIVLGS